MPSGHREQFFVELVLDWDQKREWARLTSTASRLAAICNEEIKRQVQVLGAPMAKNLYLESSLDAGFEHPLSELAVRRIKEAAHDTYWEKSRKRGMSLFPIEVDPSEVAFSTSERKVRVPYLGLVSHRPNNKILPAIETENASWVMSNVTSMRLAVRNRYTVLVIDSREDPSPKKASKKKRKASPRASRWLE